MNEPTLNSAIPGAILHKLGLVRRRKMLVQVASAIVAAVAVLFAAMGVAMLIDWLATLYDSRWRVVLTLSALAAAVLTSAGWLAMAWRRGLRWQRVAGDVDREFPQLEERWTTMTQLRPADATNPQVVHPAMLRQVASEAVRWEPHVEPEQVVSMSALKRTLIGLTAVTAVLAMAVLFDFRQTLVLLERFWLPGASISATSLVDVPGNVVIGRGEPLALAAKVDGKPVERATLFLRANENDERTIKLVAHGQEPIEFSHRVRSVEEPFAYRFRAGDGQTEWYNVDVAERPEIEKIEMTVTPPKYTGRPAKTFNKLPPRLAALQHSELELALRSEIPVESVELKLGNNQSVRLTADADGWYRWKTELEDGFSLSPILTESHGLTNRRVPKCQFTVYQDKPPAVKVLTPDDQMEVRPDDTIQITFSAQDDVGIGAAELLIYDESTPVAEGEEPVPMATIPIPLADQEGARSVQQSVDLDLAKLGFVDGSEFSYEVRVREDRGGSSQAQVATAKGPEAPTAGKGQPQTAANEAGSPKEATSNQQAMAAAPSATANSQPTSPREGEPATPNAEATAANATPPADAQGSQSAQGAKKSSTSQNQQESPESSPRVAARDGGKSSPSSTAPRSPDSSQQAAARSANSSKASQSSQSSQPSAAPRDPGPSTQQTASQTPANPSLMSESIANNQPSSNGKSQPGSQSSSQSKSGGSSSPPSQSAGSESKMANNQTEKATARTDQAGQDKSQQPGPARTATSARRALSTAAAEKNGKQPESMQNEAGPQNAAANPSKSQMANNSKQPNSAGQPAGNQQPPAGKSQPKGGEKQQANSKSGQSPGGNQTASSSSQKSPSSPSDPPPGDSMTRRALDVQPQSSSSKRMRLKVDQWAGSFAGQQRAKVEMAVASELEALDRALATGERTARGVVDDVTAAGKWSGKHDRDVSAAEKATVEAQQVITRVQQRSKDTPYAFIGLQVVDVGLAHVNPARSGFWKALESEGNDRVGSVRDAWQHLVQARKMVKDLQGQFERAKKEFQLAESVERVKKMYQVYLENSQALLRTQDNDPSRFNRKMVEFDLDDEYLARLQEVMEMRRDLRAELARILSEDPRLLRRFMDSLRNRTHSLREDLAELVSGQQDLNREVRAWTLVEEADRPRIAKILMLRQVQDAAKIASAAGELQARYQTWLPLDRESKDADLAAASKTIQQVATAAGELNAAAQKFTTEAQRPVPVSPGEGAEAAPVTGEAIAESAAALGAKPPAAADLGPLVNDGQSLYEDLNRLEVALRQLAVREEGAEAASFAASRLVETRRLIADTSAWVRQMRAHQAGAYPRAAEVDQYRLAMKTDELAGKLGAIEQSLAGLMQRQDGSLPQPIAQKAREFLTTLDKQASPNQLAGVYALHSDQMPRAVERQRAAGDALTRAEKQYDELIRMSIEELDKLPVQDPIAQLLDDPTLDELLAQLEQELPAQEILGIPLRPSNLRIVDDWLNAAGDNALSAGGGQRMLMNQMRNDQRQAQRKLDEAYRRAIARALKESKTTPTLKIPKATKLSDWNRLVSRLGDDLRQGRDKAPPEQYRRAIEQYFAQISTVVAEQERREDAAQ